MTIYSLFKNYIHIFTLYNLRQLAFFSDLHASVSIVIHAEIGTKKAHPEMLLEVRKCT